MILALLVNWYGGFHKKNAGTTIHIGVPANIV